MVIYEPSYLTPSISSHMPSCPSAWRGLEQILFALVDDFKIETKIALEFGVDYGFSTAALAEVFEEVIGVDTFCGDGHAGKRDTELQAQLNLASRDNVILVRADYRDWIKWHHVDYSLVHVDIVHTFEDTFACGDWAIQHSDCCLFHDTESFPEVRRAVEALAEKHGLTFYNYPKCHGLGILRKGR